MHDESLPGTKQADTDYTKDEALMVAEGPSTLRELVHGFHARGFALAELEKENREKRDLPMATPRLEGAPAMTPREEAREAQIEKLVDRAEHGYLSVREFLAEVRAVLVEGESPRQEEKASQGLRDVQPEL